MPVSRLKWQCRRGCKELDLLLQAYLETRYRQADDTEKKQFFELLQREDSELSELLLKPGRTETGLDGLLNKIRCG